MKLASRHRIPAYAATALLAMAVSACGGTSTTAPPGTSFGVTEANIEDGQVWAVDRPIELRFTRALDFGSVNLSTVQVTDSSGLQALGSLGPGILSSGEADQRLLRFVPACPDSGGASSAGLQPGGIRYTVSVRGTDSGSTGVVAADGSPLESSVSIGFETPTSLDPAELFYDPLSTPAAVMIRGSAGVSLSESRATLVEVGTTIPQLTYFQNQGFGFAIPTPPLPNGLPLNHRIAPENRVAFVIQFDQPISAAPANVEKIGIEYLDGTWKKLRGRAELASNCVDVGYAVRFRPEGLLPRATSLRIAIDAGLADRGGQMNPSAQAGIIDVRTTNANDPAGAPSDGLFERFFAGDPQAGFAEDTISVLAYPRAFWGSGALTAQPDAEGMSMAQSQWRHIGYGKVNPGLGAQPARFTFEGVDATGAIEHLGGAVTPVANSLGPVPLIGMESSAVSMDLGQLPDPVGTYLMNPALLSGSRVVFLPGDSSVPGAAGGLTFYGAAAPQGVLRLDIFGGCFIPGIGTPDCAPLDLFSSYPGPSDVSVQIVPQSFEIYTGFSRDLLPTDASVRILFDGAMEGPDGQPDPATALSATSGWTADPDFLSAQPWDFVRFQVVFDLDASNDGWTMMDGVPALNFLKLTYDHGM